MLLRARPARWRSRSPSAAGPEHACKRQEEYRKLIAHGTAIKSAKYVMEKDYAAASAERSRWEQELAQTEVAAAAESERESLSLLSCRAFMIEMSVLWLIIGYVPPFLPLSRSPPCCSNRS